MTKPQGFTNNGHAFHRRGAPKGQLVDLGIEPVWVSNHWATD
jgi:hypothetical protein